MSLARISARYAKSLIDFARDHNKLDRIHEDVLNLKVACDNRDFLCYAKARSSPLAKNYRYLKLCLNLYLIR
jgi:F0F1-type ATP synthase delta subunit